VLALLPLLVVATLLAGWCVDWAMASSAALAEDHTHAFDEFTRAPGGAFRMLGWQSCWMALCRGSEQFEWIALSCLLGVFGIGLMLQVAFGRLDLGRRLVPAMEPDSGPPIHWWNRTLSPRFTTAAFLVVVIALCIGGAYVLYPAPDQLFTDMNALHAEFVFAARHDDWETAQRQVVMWRPLAAKLQPAAWLRQWAITADQSRSSNELRYALSSLQQCLDHDSHQEAKLFADHLDRVYRDCRATFRQSAQSGATIGQADR
jgi:hypothetical protein